MVQGNRSSGYIRADWFTPDRLKAWSAGRLTVPGTEGNMEFRKYTDTGERPGGNHLFPGNQKKIRYIDCNNVYLPYGKLPPDDITNRTETAMTHEYCFPTAEWTLPAQKNATKIKRET